MENRELTYGEKAVGLTFNPSQNEDVAKVKKLYAEIIDFHFDARAKIESGTPGAGEAARLHSVAITEAQTAQMWAVKAITWEAK